MAIDFSGAQFGLINQLKTGNPTMDMVLCMLIPAFFAWVFTTWETTIKPWTQRMWQRWSDRLAAKEYLRNIEYELMRNSWGSVLTGQEERNNVLQKAITLYLATHSIEYQNAGCSLMTVKEGGWRNDEEEDNAKGSSPFKKYKITTTAPEGIWIDIADNLEFRQHSNENSEGDENNKVNKKKIIYSFKSRAENGMEVIDTFIENAWKFYMDELDKHTDTARYMYNMISKGETRACPAPRMALGCHWGGGEAWEGLG